MTDGTDAAQVQPVLWAGPPVDPPPGIGPAQSAKAGKSLPLDVPRGVSEEWSQVGARQ
ncbi:hypothetical protein [Nocardia fusca]|uniref:hypothetical protein n=1 Tax=Nocardia fusca TaxID=941183 RepID=UPI000A8703FD|nr:hypothetical protein [Nocardia fusca]